MKKTTTATKATIARLNKWKYKQYTELADILKRIVEIAENVKTYEDEGFELRPECYNAGYYMLDDFKGYQIAYNALKHEKCYFNGIASICPDIIETTFEYGGSQVTILDINKLVRVMEQISKVYD